MEDTKKGFPSLPANYVTIVDLQNRWMKQQQQRQEKEQILREGEKPNQKFSNTIDSQFQKPTQSKFDGNPNFKIGKLFHGKIDDKKSSGKFPVVKKVSNLKSEASGINFGDVSTEKLMDDRKVEDENKVKKKKKKNKKKHRRFSQENGNAEEREKEGKQLMAVDDQTAEVKDDQEKEDDQTAEEKNNQEKGEDRKIQPNFKEGFVGRKKWKNGVYRCYRRVDRREFGLQKREVEEELEKKTPSKIKGKGDDDQAAEVKDNQEKGDDQTVEIEPKLKEVSVSGNQWNNGKSTAAITALSRVYVSNGRVDHWEFEWRKREVGAARGEGKVNVDDRRRAWKKWESTATIEGPRKVYGNYRRVDHREMRKTWGVERRDEVNRGLVWVKRSDN